MESRSTGSSPPLPPLELAGRVMSLQRRGDPLAAYERLGVESKEAILRILPQGWSFEGKRALDFGCGAGRTLRHLLDEAESAEVWGVDIDAASVRWIKGHLSPPLSAAMSSAAPPLSFEASSFDLIWALSVFTHLTDESAPWLVELHRLLRPGALLVASYMGRWTSQTLAAEPWDEDRIGMNVLRPGHSWDAGGPLVMMSDWWVEEHWTRLFDIVHREPNVHGQTWVLLEKRDVEVSPEEVLRPGPDPREFAALRHNVSQLGSEEARIIAAYERRLELLSGGRLAGLRARISRQARDRRRL